MIQRLECGDAGSEGQTSEAAAHDDKQRMVRFEFLDQLARDLDQGIERTLEEYRALHPGFEDAIAEEYQNALGSATGAAAHPKDRASEAPTDPAIKQVGPYRIERQVGQGGMGTVYRAKQTAPIQRVVALKIVREGMNSREIIARFEAERQTIASLNHPNIAAVYDAGTTEDGRPYFVMEYVDGKRITGFAENHRLSLEDRVRMMVQVCRAVQHAHEAGVVHRDLKPSNVLVRFIDGKAFVKVIDFGIAKAAPELLQGLLSPETHSSHLLGTLEYMSPEQLASNRFEPDAQSDVYALGIVLFELVVGRHPLREDPTDELSFRKVMQAAERDDPPTPSTALSREADWIARATQLQTNIAALRADLTRGLDRITEQALATNRTQRFKSAGELATELESFLAGRVAGPAIGGERSRRTRARISARSIALAAIGVVAIAVLAVLLSRPNRPEDFAARFGFFSPVEGGPNRPLRYGEKIDVGEHFGLRYQADRPTYVFVWQEVEGKKPKLFFPSENTTLENPLPTGIGEVVLPGLNEEEPIFWIANDAGANTLRIFATTNSDSDRVRLLESFEGLEYVDDLPENSEAAARIYRDVGELSRSFSMKALDGPGDPFEQPRVSNDGTLEASFKIDVAAGGRKRD